MLDTEHLQRRWFAALLAMRQLDAHCRQLLDTLRSAEKTGVVLAVSWPHSKP